MKPRSAAPEIAFAIPGALDQPTGGYGYARAVIAEASKQGARLSILRLPDGFPFPSEGDLAETERLIATLPQDQPILFDGLAYGALPVEMLRRLNRRIVALCHHPLARETGLSPQAADALRRSETAALAEARAVIVTSGSTADLLRRDYGVAREKITIAPPGVTRRPRAGGGDPPVILAVGAVSARKGQRLLVEALSQIRDRAWTCRIVGDSGRDPAEANAVRITIRLAGLEDRVILTGAQPEPALDAAFAGASLFAHPAYFEGYGMAVAEALSAGLPIVAADADATRALVSSDAGLLFPIGDAQAMAQALAALLDDPARRMILSDGAWRAGRALPDWPATAALILDACERALS
jgi:glycosyltransferase involved in cell wall biosynthesis